MNPTTLAILGGLLLLAADSPSPAGGDAPPRIAPTRAPPTTPLGDAVGSWYWVQAWERDGGKWVMRVNRVLGLLPSDDAALARRDFLVKPSVFVWMWRWDGRWVDVV